MGDENKISMNRGIGLACLGLALLVSFWVLSSIGWWDDSSRSGQKLVLFEGRTMGTYYRVSIVDRKDVIQDEDTYQKNIDSIFDGIIDDMSNYHQHSRLSTFNQERTTTPFLISPDTAEVIRESLRLGQLTQSALDITATPLIRLWGFENAEYREVYPSKDAIAAAKKKTGLQHIRVIDVLDGVYVQKDIPDLAIDLSAIGKGFAVDKVARYLYQEGFTHYMVEVGGEIRAQGKNASGNPWRVAIERPVVGPTKAQEILQLGSDSIATSGDYRDSYQLEGEQISHIIDPRTGWPAKNPLVSVTVIHASCMTADGLATAFTVMGKEQALAYANENQIAVFLVSRENETFVEHYSPAFESYLVRN